MKISSSSPTSSHTASNNFLDSLFLSIPIIQHLAGLLNCILSPHRSGVDKFLPIGQHWQVYTRMPLMSSSLLLQQCHVCLIRLWMVWEIRGKSPYGCCFVRFCAKDLFNMARSILVPFLSTFFSIRYVSASVVHPYNSTDTAAERKIIFANC